MNIPQIQIRQQYASIGMDTTPDQLSIEQPKAEVNLKTTPLKIDIQSSQGQLEIDQSKAWDALGCGNNLKFMDRIYAQCRQFALEGTAAIVEDGNRMADITNKSNAFADIAREHFLAERPVNYFEYASSGNVNIHYTASPPKFNVQPGKVQVDVQVNHPVIDFQRGHINTYLRQKAFIEIIPPQINATV